MKEQGHCTPGVCPGTSAHGVTVSLYVHCNHPLLQLKRALPWDALFEVMRRHWQRAGKNTDGRPGLPWDVALYVPLVVLMLVKHLNAREMEAYVSENVVARVFIGRQADPNPQIRDHSNIARAYAALGTGGLEEVKALLLQVAQDGGFADASILSSDTTAQELPLGYPNEPGILRGWAQRCGRALAKLKTRAVVGVDTALAQVQTILRTVKEHHLFAKGKQAKRQVLTRLLTEVGQLIVQTRLLVQGAWLASRPGDATRSDHTADHARGGQAAHPTDRAVDHHWRSGQGQNPPCGCDAGAGAGAPQGGERGRVWSAVSSESPRWGGYVFGTLIRGVVDESKMPLQALAGYREILVHTPLPH